MTTPHSSVWLDLKCGAPGLPGPYLQELNAAYRHLDALAGTHPRLILLIGGETKRRQLAASFPLAYRGAEKETVSIRQLSQGRSLIAIDGELHLKRDLPRILGGPCPGHYTDHYLRNVVPSPSTIATKLYSQVLAPFCTIAVIFVADFCGLEKTIDFLELWLRNTIHRSQAINRTPLHVVLVPDGRQRRPVPSIEQLWFEIIVALLKNLRALEPTSPHTFAKLRKTALSYMRLELLPELADHALAEALLARSDPAVSFSAHHLRCLLKQAVRSFAEQPQITFDTVLASRANIELPPGWQDRVLDFARLTRQSNLQLVPLIASALALNAFPPGMHRM